jgi:hypothetical protein
MTDPILRYILIKPRLWMRAGGFYLGDPRIAINGQYNYYEPIKCGNNNYGFHSYNDLLIDYYCKNAGMYGARNNPENYELRGIISSRLINTQDLSCNQLDIAAFHIDESDPRGKISFPITESDYDKYLLGKQIHNPRYQPAKKSWFQKAIENVFKPKFEDTQPEPKTYYNQVDTKVPEQEENFLFDRISIPVIDVESSEVLFNTPREQTEAIPVNSTVVLTSTTAPIKTSYSSALMVVDKPKQMRSSNFASVIGKSIFYGMLAGGLLYLINIGARSPSPIFGTGQSSPSATVSLVPENLNIDTNKINEFDNVTESITPQTSSVCNDLQTPPNESLYEAGKNSKWYKIDSGKHHECKITSLMTQISQMTDQSQINIFKTQNAPQATLHFNQSLAWNAQ